MSHFCPFCRIAQGQVLAAQMRAAPAKPLVSEAGFIEDIASGAFRDARSIFEAKLYSRPSPSPPRIDSAGFLSYFQSAKHLAQPSSVITLYGRPADIRKE